MTWDTQTIIALITAVGAGGVLQAIITFFKDRKKIGSDAHKTDVETKLAYLNAVIERLVADNDRLQDELEEERSGSALLRKRVRELEDEIDAVRKAARDTQHKCDELAERLSQLLDDAQEK